MKIGVMGAGAVGCFTAECWFVPGTRWYWLAARGMSRRSTATASTSRCRPSGNASAWQPRPTRPRCGLRGRALLRETGDSAQAAAEMAPRLGAGTLLLSLQNGVDNAERLQAALGRPVVPAVVYVATEMAGPGHLRHHGRGEPSSVPAGLRGLQGGLRCAGVPVAISDNVIGALWLKLVANCAQRPLGDHAAALRRHRRGRERLADAARHRGRMRGRRRRCRHRDARRPVAERRGHRPHHGHAEILPRSTSPAAAPEIDHLNGYVVAQGAAVGVPTPVNSGHHAIVRLMEGADTNGHNPLQSLNSRKRPLSEECLSCIPPTTPRRTP